MDDNTNNANEEEVQEAEIVSLDETVETPTSIEDTVEDEIIKENISEEDFSPENPAVSMLNLEDLVKRHIHDIDRLQEQYKKQKEMYDDGFETEGEYAQKADELETMKRAVRAIKDRITSQSSMIDLAQKMTATKEEIKELKESLSAYLEEYQKTTKATQIEIDKGDIRQIINVIKLVKKNSQYKP